MADFFNWVFAFVIFIGVASFWALMLMWAMEFIGWLFDRD